MEVELPFPKAIKRPAPTSWWVLAHGSGDDYGRVTLATGKSGDQVLCSLTPGQWSEQIVTTIKMEDGSELEVFTCCKLIELSEDLGNFKMLVGALIPTKGWVQPVEAGEGLKVEKGAIHSNGGMIMGMLGSIDLDTYVEMNHNLSTWNAECAVALMESTDWDLFYMHSHPIDWMYHLVILDMISEDQAKREKAWEVHRRIYEIEDRMLERLLSQADKDTLVVVVSDHGATPDGRCSIPTPLWSPPAWPLRPTTRPWTTKSTPLP